MILKKAHNNSFLILIISIVSIVLLIVIKPIINKKNKIKLLVPEIEQQTTLQSIQITLKDKHYKKLKKKRDKSVADEILESNDKDYVPALITYQGEDFKANIRLKGDWTDHLEGEKWSFRIKLKGGKTILGMRKFSIHHPKTRNYINEWLFHKVHKEEGLMGLRYQFTEGFLHIKHPNSLEYLNKNLGIYAIEEAFDKRSIESNQRKEGIIMRFSETNYWKEIKAGHKIKHHIGYPWEPVLSPIFNINTSGHITTFGLERILKDKVLHSQFIQAKNMLHFYSSGKLKTSDVFDVDKLALHVAISNLFGAHHTFSLINMRMYYNPTTSLLEPISSDGNSGYAKTKVRHYYRTDLIGDTIYTKALIKAFEKVSKGDYLENIFLSYKKKTDSLEKRLKKEFGKKTIINKDNYKKNQVVLRKELGKMKEILLQKQ